MLFKESIKYPITFSLISGKTDFDTYYTSINRCIGLILTTGKGELVGDPEFGCRLYELLFNQYNETLESDVKREIIDSLSRFESRITVTEAGITITPVENAEKIKYNININYRLSSADLTGETNIVLVEREVNG